MKKNIAITIFTIFSIFIYSNNALAKEIYYTNKNNVSFTKEEYDFLNLMFWNGSQDLFTLNDYNKLIESNIMNGNITIKYSNEIMPLDVEHTSKAKSIKLATSCNSDCLVSVTETWKENPTIKSYDVMGVRLSNTSLLNSPLTTIVSSNGLTISSNTKKLSNDFGESIDLSKTGNNIIISQVFKVSKGGHVYATYQHATKNISLTDSKNYNISNQGYGKVFEFKGTAIDIYDKSVGIDIAV